MPQNLNFSPPNSKSALAIFCRAPRLGQVKTRLAQTHGEPFALGLYRAMLADSFDLGRALSPETQTFACFSPRDGFEGDHSLLELWNGPKLAQCDGDLGTKMLGCFADLRALGFEKIVIIGSDSPDLPLPRLKRAFEKLNQSKIVIGSAPDGGFHLIGAAGEFPAWIFENVVWSSENTLGGIVQNFKRFHARNGEIYPWSQLSPWWDADDAEDLSELRRRLFEVGTHAPHTREFLGKNEM